MSDTPILCNGPSSHWSEDLKNCQPGTMAYHLNANNNLLKIVVRTPISAEHMAPSGEIAFPVATIPFIVQRLCQAFNEATGQIINTGTLMPADGKLPPSMN